MNKQRNYELLKLKNPRLYEQLLKVQVANEQLEIVTCQDGRLTLKVNGIDDKKVQLNSKYGLQREIDKEVSTVDYDASLIIWFGIGMGHELREVLLHKDRGIKVIIAEPRLDLLKMALEYADFTDILGSDDIYLIAGMDRDMIQQQICDALPYDIIYGSDNIWKHYLPYCQRVYHQESITILWSSTSERIVYHIMNTGNDSEDTLLGINHFFSNIKYILKSPVLNEIGDTYKGYPAICVAAGPSLDKNINVLKELQDKALIFAADAVWERLVYEGVTPDAISVLERIKKTYRFFFQGKCEQIPEQTCILAHSVVYPQTLSNFKGSYIITSKSQIPFEKLAGDVLPQLNNYNTGLSCAHTSFAIAKVLGCDPIIVIGQDLAYGDDGYSHARGTYGEKKTKASSQFKDRDHFFVPNITRTGVVETNDTYNLFRLWFENEVAQDDSHLYINATEGGAYIAGMEVLTLQEVGKRYLQHGKKKIRLVEVLEQPSRINDRLLVESKAIKFFAKELQCLYRVHIQLNEINKEFEKISIQRERWDDPRQFTKAAQWLNQLHQQIQQIASDSTVYFFLIQFTVVEIIRILIANRKMRTIEQLSNVYDVIENRLKKMSYRLQQLIYEYERGIQILKNHGECDDIQTPLMGEMYE